MTIASVYPVTARLTRAWVGLVVRHAWIVVIAGVVCGLAFAVYAARHLGINTSTADMIAPHLQWRQAFLDYRDAFPVLDHNLIVVIDGPDADHADAMRDALSAALQARPDLYVDVYAPGSDAYFRQNGLLYQSPEALQDLSDRLAQAQPMLVRLNADPTMAGLFGLLSESLSAPPDAPKSDISPLLERIAEVVVSVNEARPDALSWQSLLQGQAEQPRREIIVVKPHLDFSQLQPARTAIEFVRAEAATINAHLVEPVSVRLSGPVALEFEELQSVTRGAKRAGVLAMAMVLVILAFALRSAPLVVACLATLLAGLAATAAFAAFAVGDLNLISVAFAVLYIGLGIDFAIHYCLRVREALTHGVDLDAALIDSAGDVGASLVLCAITTSVGFFAFFPTAFRGVSELGLISGTGMYISLFMTLSFLPALLSVLPLQFEARDKLPVFRLFTAIARHRALWPVVAVVTLLSLFALPAVQFDSDPLRLRDPASESVAAFNDLLADPLYAPRALLVLADASQESALRLQLDALDTVAATRTLESFVPDQQSEKLAVIDEIAWLLGPGLDRVSEADASPERARAALDKLAETLADTIDSQARPPNGADQLAAALQSTQQNLTTPAQDDLLQRLDRALVGTLPARLNLLRDSFNASPVDRDTLPESIRSRWHTDDSRTRIAIQPANKNNMADNTVFVDSVRDVAPGATGLAVVQVEAGRAVVGAFQQAFVTAIVLISAILILLLRNVRHVLVVLVPLLGAGLYTIAAMVVVGMPFNFANVIALPLLLGVGVDNGIHMVTRWKDGADALLASSTARAVLASSLTTIASFGNLAFSPHPGSASMGQVLAIGMIATTLCTLILVPALLQRSSR